MEFFFGPNVYILEWFSRIGFSEKSFNNQVIMAKIEYSGSKRTISISAKPDLNLQIIE